MIGKLSWQRWVFACAVAAALGWMLGSSGIAAPTMVRAVRQEWQLIDLPSQAEDIGQAAVVAELPMWGPEAKLTGQALAPVEQNRWRIAGVYGRGSNAGVLLLFDDPAKAPQRLTKGEKLPSGHVIEAVEGNQVCIRIGKKLYRLGVEQGD